MRRVYINIGVFTVIATALIVWSALDFLHLDAIERPYLVTAEFAESPGLRAGYEVTYLGHAVGRIRDVELVPGMSEVKLAIDRDVDLPGNVVAAARRRSAIGEPYVDLAPAPGTDPDAGARLAHGDRILLENTSSPLQYGDLFRSLDTLVSTIDPTSLGIVVDELAASVDGRGDDIRRIVHGTSDLTQALSESGDEIEELIDGVAEITEILATHRDALGSGIESLARLTEALDSVRPSITTLLDEAPSTIALLNTIVDASDHAVMCTIDGTAVLDVVLDDETIEAVELLLQRSAAFADVIALLQDPHDGIFRLYVSPSGGNPPTVEYAAPQPFPAVPELAGCPEHDVAVTTSPVSGEARPGSGGQRPPGDGVGAPSDRPAADGSDAASGDTGIEAGDSFFTRLLAALGTWLPVVVAIVAIGTVLYMLARRRGGHQ